MRKLLVTASALAIMAGVPAVAQTPAPETAPAPSAQPAPAPDAGATAPKEPAPEMKSTEAAPTAAAGQWRSSKLVGQSIRNGANESIGDINDLIVDNDGKVTAVVVGVGGFLGMGEKNVALTFDQLSVSRDSNNSLVVMANATKESLQAAPEWKDPTMPATTK